MPSPLAYSNVRAQAADPLDVKHVHPQITVARLAVISAFAGFLSLYKFGVLSTSTLSGLNLTHSIGLRDTAFFSYLDDVDHRDVSRADLPSVLVRERKIEARRISTTLRTSARTRSSWRGTPGISRRLLR
jgi:hypothetical protein